MNAQLEDWRSRGRSFDYLGFEVFFRQQGAGPVLLLIHGYPFSSFDWHPIWPALTDRFTVIAPDMLGMGFSAKPVEYEYSVHDHADMHEDLLRHLACRSAMCWLTTSATASPRNCSAVTRTVTTGLAHTRSARSPG